jgi:hypothetical protein
MLVVLRSGSLKIIIFRDDHEPAHVHIKGDGDAKINLFGLDGLPELVWSRGMNRAERRRAIQVVRTEQLYLFEEWRRIHG